MRYLRMQKHAWKRTLTALTVAVGMSVALHGWANAAPLPTDGSWHLFFFGGPGSTATPTFTLSPTTPVVLTVLDWLCTGDRFQVLDGTTVLGTSSLVAAGACPGVNDALDCAIALGRVEYSRGLFLLSADPHTITMRAVASPHGDGAGCIRAQAMTTNDCKNGGWQQFGVFKNQGDCVSFIASGGRNLGARQ